MRKSILILVTLTLFTLGINTVLADVPSVISLDSTDTTDGRTLTITIRHNGPTSVHYVNEIEVKVGDDTSVVQLTAQSTTAFTETVDIAATGDVQVRAYCTVHGWSSWARLGGEQEPTGGIPGFPLLALVIGLAAFTLLRDR